MTKRTRIPDYLKLPMPTHRTKWLAGAVLFAGFFLSPVHFVLFAWTGVAKTKLFLNGVVSSFAILTGFLGFFQATPTLVVSFMTATASCYFSTLLGGISLLTLIHIDVPVIDYLDEQYLRGEEPSSQELDRNAIREQAKLFFILSGSLLLTNALANAALARHFFGSLGTKRASTAFSQTFSLVIIPFALFLIASAQFIADSAMLSSAPYTGLIILLAGVLMLGIALLAFVGANFEYRRFLLLCICLTFLVGVSLLGASISYFVVRKSIQEQVIKNWPIIRIVLPPTSQAKYDEQQFLNLVENNLESLAFLGATSGLFFLIQSNVSMSLRHEADQKKKQQAQDAHEIKHVPSKATSENPHHLSLRLRHEWKLLFHPSTLRQRIALRLCTLVVLIGIGLVIGTMIAQVIFATQCNVIGDDTKVFNETFTSHELFHTSISNFSKPTEMVISNAYDRGSMTIIPTDSSNFSIASREYAKEQTLLSNGVVKSLIDDQTVAFKLEPKKTLRFLWIDGSCQRLLVEFQVPRSFVSNLVIQSNASVLLKQQKRISYEKLQLNGLAVTTDQANIELEGVKINDNSVRAYSNAGQIQVSMLEVNASLNASAQARAQFKSTLGPVIVTNSTFVECGLQVETGASSLNVSNIVSLASNGDDYVHSKSVSGRVHVEAVRARWIKLASINGLIEAQNLIVRGDMSYPSRLEIFNVAGNVRLDNIATNGFIQAETSTGNIVLTLKSLAFVGLYYLRSEFGQISVRRGTFATGDTLAEFPATRQKEKYGSINCQVGSASCSYGGDIHLRSQYGNIEIIVGCDSPSCLY